MPQTIVISGVSRGLGKSLAQKFLERGDYVIGLSLTRKHWPSLKKDCPSSGTLTLKQVDVSKEQSVKSFVSWFKKQKISVDVLINNAGYGGNVETVENTSAKEFEKSHSLNLTSVFLMCKYFLPLFQKQNAGQIINVSSMAGVRGVPKLFAYSAAKFGILALTQCIAKENEKAKFECYTISPGGMNTQMRAGLFGAKDASRQQSTEFVGEKILEVIDKKIPLQNGSNIIIRHGKISGIQALPSA